MTRVDGFDRPRRVLTRAADRARHRGIFARDSWQSQRMRIQCARV
jgi:hypothetical protein